MTDGFPEINTFWCPISGNRRSTPTYDRVFVENLDTDFKFFHPPLFWTDAISGKSDIDFRKCILIAQLCILMICCFPFDMLVIRMPHRSVYVGLVCSFQLISNLTTLTPISRNPTSICGDFPSRKQKHEMCRFSRNSISRNPTVICDAGYEL